MLIKPSINSIDLVDDITNIKNSHRFIIIYKYKTPRSAVLHEDVGIPIENIYCNDFYGLYLVNVSSIDGIDYIVPSKYLVHSRNGYRGSCKGAINPDGSLNKNSLVNFYIGSYSNRIHNKSKNTYAESFNTALAISSDYSSEAEMQALLKSQCAMPFPIYYNFEEQARIAQTNFKDVDFMLNYDEVPVYRLGDLIDNKTTVLVVDVDGEDNNIILDTTTTFVDFGNNTTKVDISSLKDNLLDIFVDCFWVVMNSVFSQAYFIFDIQSGLFNIPPECLKTKFKYGIDKEVIKQGYAELVEKGSELAEKVSYISYDITSQEENFNAALPQIQPNGNTIYDLLPDKLYVYTSLSTCSLKLQCSSLYGLNNKSSSSIHMNICATGDTDEISQYYTQGCDYDEICYLKRNY